MAVLFHQLTLFRSNFWKLDILECDGKVAPASSVNKCWREPTLSQVHHHKGDGVVWGVSGGGCGVGGAVGREGSDGN